MEFTALGLAEPLLRALEDEGYATPTPIQEKAIPGVLAGRDLLGIAQTGTGKTAAFALPILHNLMLRPARAPGKGCRVLVLAPTRELAAQIAASFRTYGQFLPLSVAVIVGGVGHGAQQRDLARGVDVVVATPGRLLDHVQSGHARLDAAGVVVLDEADHMLDLGFLPPIRRILARLPKQRQTLFFSATMPSEIGTLAAELLNDPLRVSAAPAATTVERVAQRVYLVDAPAKRGLLVELLNSPGFARTLVFTRTKRGADRVMMHLREAGLAAAAIHGNKSQPQRERALAAFRGGQASVLVATDIAARGIDVDGVSHVINFELPDVAESYVHRIGRTARAGAEGIAITLCAVEEDGLLRDIEKLTRQKLPAENRRQPGAARVERTEGTARPQRRPAPGRGGKPQGKSRAPQAKSRSFGAARHAQSR